MTPTPWPEGNLRDKFLFLHTTLALLSFSATVSKMIKTQHANVASIDTLTAGTVRAQSYSLQAGYKVGDVGPAGGIIFFVDYNNEYPDFNYLEVSPYIAANNAITQAITAARVIHGGATIEYDLSAVPSSTNPSAVVSQLAGANVTNMSPPEFNFNQQVITFSANLRSDPLIVKGEVVGSDIVYTTLDPHRITTGTLVTVTGFVNPYTAFNVASTTVTAVTANTFSVTNVAATGTVNAGAEVVSNRFTTPNLTGATGVSAGGGLAPTSRVVWSSLQDNWTGVASFEAAQVDAGPANTAKMLQTSTFGAAHVAANFTLNGFDDWFLPSSGAMKVMYNNVVGPFCVQSVNAF
jgi:hypothetical protein